MSRVRKLAVADVASSWLVPVWPAPANVRAVVTTRAGPGLAQNSPFGFNVGVHCGDDPDAVARNREFLQAALTLPSVPRWLRQVHGTQVVHVDSPRPNPAPFAGEGARRVDGGDATGEADAAVTRTPGVVLAIQTADCLPVLFCADDGSEIAAAHAGWRGLVAGVLDATVTAMHTPRANILAWLGPAIAAKSYEVGDEVRGAFIAHEATAAAAFTAARTGHWQCDLYALARQRLHAAGVTRMFGGGFDTFTDPRLHSFRRDAAHSGRMASLVWMAQALG
jgi:YfiH family protein